MLNRFIKSFDFKVLIQEPEDDSEEEEEKVASLPEVENVVETLETVMEDVVTTEKGKRRMMVDL